MDPLSQPRTETPIVSPAAFASLSDRSGEDIILRLILRELARGRSNRQRAERRRDAARRGRQFERRALAALRA
jgi:hypothetical protein